MHRMMMAAVLGLLAWSGMAAGEARLRLHVDFNDEPVQTADGKQVLLEKITGQPVELHNAARAEGRFGKALACNGKTGKDGGAYAVLPQSPKTPFLVDFSNGPFTLEVWFKPSSEMDYRQQQELVNTAGDTGPGYRLTYTWRMMRFMSGSSTRDAAGKSDYWAVTTTPAKHKVLTDAWNHAAVVRDAEGFVTLYLNGEAAAKSEKPFPVIPAAIPLTLGAYRAGYAYPLMGLLDDVRVYEGAKTAEEVFQAAQGIGTDATVRLDGRLDDPLWSTAQRFGDFRYYKGAAPAAPQTEVLIAGDRRTLYFGIVAHEPNMDKLVDAVREHSMKVYSDDCVEIMLDADNNAADYYHFIINPSGYRGQEMRVQTGFVGDAWPNTAWSAAVSKDKDRWVAEVAIPYAILTREAGLSKDMRFNVTRNCRTVARDQVESSVAGGVFNTPGKFPAYTAAELNPADYPLRLSTPVLADMRMARGALQTTITMKATTPLGAPADMALTAALVSAGNQVIPCYTSVAVKPNAETPLDLTFALAEPGACRLVLAGQVNGAPAYYDVSVMPVHFVPLAVDVQTPFYRNTIYPSETIGEVKAAVRIGLTPEQTVGSALRLALKDAAGKILVENTVSNPALKQAMTLPIGELAAGDYTLTATLAREGKTLAEASERLRKLGKAPGTEVRIDEKLRMVVNGRPRLPIVWWTGAPFEEIARTGSDGVIVGFSRNPRSALDQAHAAGQMAAVVLMAGNTSQQLMVNRTEFTAEMREYVQDVIKAAADHPAMLCWYLTDEPEVRAIDANLLRQYYELLVELDPWHPVLITNDTVRGLHTYAAAMDMFVPDPYIIPEKGGGPSRPMSYVVEFMENARQAGQGRKLIGMTPQVFNYGDYGQHNGRAPSFVEQRCQQYLAIVHGARLFSYYIYKGIKGYPELEIGVPELMKEIRAVTPFILEGDPLAEAAASDAAIHCAAWRYGGKLFMIACNITPREVAARLALPGANTVKVIGEDRHLDGMADTFGPYETHLYTTDLDFADPISLKDLQARIEAAHGVYTLKY